MHVGLYGDPLSSSVLRALADFATDRHFRVTWRNPQRYKEDQHESFDMVFVEGMHGHRAALAQNCMARGEPVFCLDTSSYLRRDGNYFRMALGSFNWTPPFDCPPDRLDRLELEMSRRRVGKYVLVCMPSPALADATRARTWLTVMGERAALATTLPVEVRAHPGPREEGPPLADALKDAAVVVAYDSNIGNDALLAGVPVICHESAQYAALANHAAAPLDKLYFPTDDERDRYFAKVAYAQWTLNELSNGDAFNFALGIARQEVPDYQWEPRLPIRKARASTGAAASPVKEAPAEAEAEEAGDEAAETEEEVTTASPTESPPGEKKAAPEPAPARKGKERRKRDPLKS